MALLEALQTEPGLALSAAVLLGLLVGSFLNVVILRLPRMLEQAWTAECAELAGATPGKAAEPFNLLVPRSRCPACGHPITMLENVPILSYLFLRGRCSACGTPIGIRYPLVEAAAALLAVVALWHFGFGLAALGAMLFGWMLLALSVIDLDHQLLPDSLTLPLLWLGLAFNLAGTYVPLADAVLGAILGYGFLWAVFHLFRLLTGKEGMGFGDFKLLAALGAWAGWQALPVIVLLSSLVGAVIGLGLILLRGRDRNLPIPFGPYLALAGWLGLFWGEALVNLYLGWISVR